MHNVEAFDIEITELFSGNGNGSKELTAIFEYYGKITGIYIAKPETFEGNCVSSLSCVAPQVFGAKIQCSVCSVIF